jgi:hypothetical protein
MTEKIDFSRVFDMTITVDLPTGVVLPLYSGILPTPASNRPAPAS